MITKILGCSLAVCTTLVATPIIAEDFTLQIASSVQRTMIARKIIDNQCSDSSRIKSKIDAVSVSGS